MALHRPISPFATTSCCSLAATHASQAEGNSGTTPFTFTVTRTGDTSGTTTANYYGNRKRRKPYPLTPCDFGGAFQTRARFPSRANVTSQVITINVGGDLQT